MEQVNSLQTQSIGPTLRSCPDRFYQARGLSPDSPFGCPFVHSAHLSIQQVFLTHTPPAPVQRSQYIDLQFRHMQACEYLLLNREGRADSRCPPSELPGTSDSQSGAPCLCVPVYTCEPARAPQGVTMTQLHKASGYLCGCVCGHSPEYRLLFPGGCDSTAHGDPGAHRPAVSSQLPSTGQAK